MVGKIYKVALCSIAGMDQNNRYSQRCVKLNMIKNNELSVSIVDINQPNYDTIYTLNLNSQSKSKLDKIPIYPT